MILPLLLTTAQIEDAPDPSLQSIPAIFHGEWSPAAIGCKPGTEPYRVTIGARRVDYYEAQGYLQLAKLNHASDPPAIRGRYSFTGELQFWDAVIDLQVEGGRLILTEAKLNDDFDDAKPSGPMIKCPKQ